MDDATADNDTITYPTGARGSRDATSYRYDLISPIAMKAEAKVACVGAARYGDHQWESGITATENVNRAIRHLYEFLSGDHSEEHLAHARFRVGMAIHSLEAWPELNKGTLRGPGCTPPVSKA